MRQYELTYLISDVVPENELNKVTGKVGGYIRDLGGQLSKEEIWGRRKLAYPIKKQEFATYVTANFELPAEKAKEFEKNILLTGKIIRHLLLVKDLGEKSIALTSEDIAENKEITEVIGGERSFEAVEGETEESKELMAKRAEQPETEEETKEEITSVATEEKEKEETETPEVVVEEKPAKKRAVKKPAKAVEEKEEVKEEKPAKAKKSKKDEPGNEAERLSKLDEELDKFLGEDL